LLADVSTDKVFLPEQKGQSILTEVSGGMNSPSITASCCL